MNTQERKVVRGDLVLTKDFVFDGYNLNSSDVQHLRDNAGLDTELYAKLRPRQFILIPQEDRGRQKIIDRLG